MQQKNINIDKVLPYGESINGFLALPQLTNANLKSITRGRGIFMSSEVKENTIPLLQLMLLSPSEFDMLKEYQNTKEDSPKYYSSTLEWNNVTTLIEAVEGIESFSDLVNLEYANYKIVGNPVFFAESGNPNKILMSLDIERSNLSKLWYNSTDRFSGSIEIELLPNKTIKIATSYTSTEVRHAAREIINGILKHFNTNNYIATETKLQKILFSDFGNKERFLFLLAMSKDIQNKLEYNDIVDINLRPHDDDALPRELEWMKSKSALILKGKNLIETTSFLKDKTNYEVLVCWGIEIKFKFNHLNNKGIMLVQFGFPDYPEKNKGDAEFEINITSVVSTESRLFSANEKKNLKKTYLKILDNRKTELYNKFIENK